jgi:hypothetical protein
LSDDPRHGTVSPKLKKITIHPLCSSPVIFRRDC